MDKDTQDITFSEGFTKHFNQLIVEASCNHRVHFTDSFRTSQLETDVDLPIDELMVSIKCDEVFMASISAKVKGKIVLLKELSHDECWAIAMASA